MLKNSETATSRPDEIIGVVQGHRDGHGFVVPQGSKLGLALTQRASHWLEANTLAAVQSTESDVFLSPEQMRTVLHRDVVRVRVVGQDRRGRPEGQIVDIVQRQQKTMIGRLVKEHGVWLLAPEDKRFSQDIFLPGDAACGPAKEGQVVEVALSDEANIYTQPTGHVIAVLGDIEDAGIEIEIAVRKFDLPHTFGAAVEACAAKLPDHVRDADQKNRVDLRDVPLVTIDGEDARDFDDAVYCQPHAGDANTPAGWRLLVAIADVSHYVQPKDAIDEEAAVRTTSVYFPRRVIPMLPEKLSNGLCSLVPQQNRLAMVCDMVVDTEGDVVAYQFYPAVICSHARLTYTQVAAMLTNSNGPEAQQFAKLLPHILDLHSVYRSLLGSRQRRGAMEIETVETFMVCNALGQIERIEPRVRNEAHRLIEEAMLAANVCTAEFVSGQSHPALFRSHEGPTPEKRASLAAYLRAMGVSASLSPDPQPSEYQAIALATAERPDAVQIQTMLLRSMQQAVYTPHNSGHFGLAYGAYTHFTSPIRRYPDLLVHRVIKARLVGKCYNIVTGKTVQKLPTTAGMRQRSTAKNHDTVAAPTDAQTQAWESMGAHCSGNERRADEASRDVQQWLKCRFMAQHLGQNFSGKVTGITPFGLFITLDDLYVEGLIHISDLGTDYFRYDETRQELRGERTGMRYRLATAVQVQVSRVDLDARKIDLRLVSEITAPSRKGASGASRRTSSAAEPTIDGRTAPGLGLSALQLQEQEIKRLRRDLKPAKPSRAKSKSNAVSSSKKSKRVRS